jgi:hypothetical protein
MKDGHMPEQPHIEEAAQAHLQVPEPTVNGPAGARQLTRLPAPAHFYNRGAIALLRQPERRNAAAKAGSDNDKVEIELAVVGRHTSTIVLENRA